MKERIGSRLTRDCNIYINTITGIKLNLGEINDGIGSSDFNHIFNDFHLAQGMHKLLIQETPAKSSRWRYLI